MSREGDSEHDIEGARSSGPPPPPPPGSPTPPIREFFRQRAERFEFSLLATEDDELEDEKDHEEGPRAHIIRHRQSLKPTRHTNLMKRVQAHMRTEEDPFFDLPEDYKVVVEAEGVKQVRVPTLVECQGFLQNKETETYRQRAVHPLHLFVNLLLNISAAFVIWIINMTSFETIVVVCNAMGAAAFFADPKRVDEWNLKLDFSFLAFAVVFPLTFLISSTFARREQALSFLADYKSSLLSTALMTLTVDWPTDDSPNNGRLSLPRRFNAQVVKDCRELVKLTYEYLSMPQVSHARNHVFWNKQRATKRVHALQNGIVQDINDYLYDFSMHTEVMKKHGFPSGEASRLHQYHQYMQQRFEHLRQFKYYRTPQSTRSFGRVYILVLPWFTGPYWAWMADGTTRWFAIISSAFTFSVLLGLLNAQQGLEDPFVADYQSLMPGIDTVKLEYEMALLIQAIEQYYATAELQRAWELRQREKANDDDNGEGEEEVAKEQVKEVRKEQKSKRLDRQAEMTRSELSRSDVGVA